MRTWTTAFVLALLVGVAAGTQWWDGATAAELSFEPDEPAHFVTGLMIHRYIADGAPGNPMRYAERYYVRYPKVAIGHWPPLFYGLEALWFFPFGGTIASALALQALIAGAIGLVVFVLLRPVIGWWAIAPAAWLLLLRTARDLTGAVMLEPLAVLWEVLAAAAWIRYLETATARWAYLFALAATAALMTRGDAMFLALFPLASIALSGRWALLRQKALWLSAAIVLVLCGPWYVLTLRMVKDGWTSSTPSMNFMLEALGGYLGGLPLLAGAGTVALAAVGVIAGRTMAGRERWAGWIGYGASLLVFHCLVPASVEERRLFSLTPVLFILAGYGAKVIAQRWGGPVPAGALLLVVMAAVDWMVVRSEPKRHYGYRETIATLLGRAELKGMNILASSAVDGEGMTISEVASRENAPARYTIRASKLMASSNWSGSTYQSAYKTPAELVEALAASPVQIVVTDTFPDNTPQELTFEVHNGLLHQTIAAYPERFRLIEKRPGPGGEILAYLFDEGKKREGVKMDIDLSLKLGRKVGE